MSERSLREYVASCERDKASLDRDVDRLLACGVSPRSDIESSHRLAVIRAKRSADASDPELASTPKPLPVVCRPRLTPPAIDQNLTRNRVMELLRNRAPHKVQVIAHLD
jgi:hypothetical protein